MNIGYLVGIDLDISIWLLLLFDVLLAYYLYMTWHNNIFKKLGVPGPKPTPILGTLIGMFKGGMAGHDEELVKKYGNIVGAFTGRAPCMIIADPVIAKEVLVKQFNNFVDRMDTPFDEDEMAGNMIQLVQEKKWRNLRNTLSPTFSSGKLKRMAKYILECSDQLIKNIEDSRKDGKEIDFKEYSRAFTMDTIARTVFALELNSKTENSKFVEMANKTMLSSFKSPLFIILFFFKFLLPFVTKLGIGLFPKESSSFYRQIIIKLIEERKSNPLTKHPDFMQLMLNAHKDESNEDQGHHEVDTTDMHRKKPLTENEILGSCFIFFLAGYETTANTLSFAIHLLATNPECQDRLYDEITSVLKGKEPDYTELPNLHYLESVIDETLRIYPQAPRIQRIAKEEVVINKIRIPKGMEVVIPVTVMHNNPKFWTHPEIFDPERFTPEKKAERDPYCYLPFGHGPRNCIGMRLALVELKIVMIKLLQKYKINKCPETQVNLKQEKVRAGPDGGVFIKLTPRE